MCSVISVCLLSLTHCGVSPVRFIRKSLCFNGCWRICSPHRLWVSPCRDSTEEAMELSEEERNELMKKESSRLLKTGHRVSYSPRKEKALKIYLDGGPTKDSGQD